MGEAPKQKDNAPPKKKDDEGYKSAIERMPDQKFDPWRNMR
jgi:ribosomal protein S30